MNDSTTTPETKRCIKCGEVKPLEMFGKDKLRSDGLFPHCKLCRRRPHSVEAEKDRLSWAKDHKRCCTCRQIKHVDMFIRHCRTSDGFTASCKPCFYEKGKTYTKRAFIFKPDSKVCPKCQRDLPSNMFCTSRRSLSGLFSRCKDCDQKHRQGNADTIRARRKESYLANRRAILDRQKKSLDQYPMLKQIRRLYTQAWKRANPTKLREYDFRRRSSIANSGGRGITEADIQAMIYCQQGLCAYCERDGQKLTLDHVIPVRYGGMHDPDNASMCCGICNSSKNDRTLEQWVDRWYLRDK